MSKITDIKLYSYYLSSASWRVRAALALKKIPFEYKLVNLLGGEQHEPEFANKVNPLHQAPAIEFKDDKGNTHILNQSLAIIQLLEHYWPEPSLWPKDPILRAKTQAIAETISSGMQPLQNLETLLEYGEPVGLGKLGADERKKVAQFWLNRKFSKLEALVKQTSGKYCVGDEVTVADLTLVPQMFNARRFEMDLSNCPILNAINERMLELDFIKAGHPTSCPEGKNFSL